MGAWEVAQGLRGNLRRVALRPCPARGLGKRDDRSRCSGLNPGGRCLGGILETPQGSVPSLLSTVLISDEFVILQ